MVHTHNLIRLAFGVSLTTFSFISLTYSSPNLFCPNSTMYMYLRNVPALSHVNKLPSSTNRRKHLNHFILNDITLIVEVTCMVIV